MIHRSSFDDPRDVLESAFGKIKCDHEIGGGRRKTCQWIGATQPENFVPDQELSRTAAAVSTLVSGGR